MYIYIHTLVDWALLRPTIVYVNKYERLLGNVETSVLCGGKRFKRRVTEALMEPPASSIQTSHK